MKKRHLVFGPVLSRRLGRSLGIDLIPYKTCTFDCVYCELGTIGMTIRKRARYVDPEEIFKQVGEVLAEGAEPDVITLSGSGEPTLHTDFGYIIDGLREMSGLPVVLLTNGSLFYLPEVRKDAGNADIIIPSLDAGDEETFKLINRPHSDISFEKMVKGLTGLGRDYPGRVWLEVMLLDGLNDSAEHVQKIAGIAETIAPARIQLNTASRPPAEKDTHPLSPERLTKLAALFSPLAEVVSYGGNKRKTQGKRDAGQEELIEMLLRRPGNMEDITSGLGMEPGMALRILGTLSRDGMIQREVRNGTVFYSLDRSMKTDDGTDTDEENIE